MQVALAITKLNLTDYRNSEKVSTYLPFSVLLTTEAVFVARLV